MLSVSFFFSLMMRALIRSNTFSLRNSIFDALIFELCVGPVENTMRDALLILLSSKMSPHFSLSQKISLLV